MNRRATVEMLGKMNTFVQNLDHPYLKYAIDK